MAPRNFTISGVSEDDVISLGFEVRNPVLQVSGSYSEGVYSGTISGVNLETQDYNVSVKVNDTVVCTFIIKGKPYIEIAEISKNIEINNDMAVEIDVTVFNTEDLVTSFDISAEGLTTLTDVPFDEATDNTYAVTLSSDSFDVAENGTYNATLKANLEGGRALTDTFTLKIAIVEDEQTDPLNPDN